MEVEVEVVLRSTGEPARVSGKVEPDRYGHLVVSRVAATVRGEVVGLRPRELFDVGCLLRTGFRLAQQRGGRAA